MDILDNDLGNKYIDLGALGEIELVEVAGSDISVVCAARVSYGKRKTELDEADIKLIKYLIKHNHVSVLEHNLMTFRVKLPKPIAVQWMRHQSQKFNEISGRYVEFEDEFYIPEKFRKQHESSKQASVEAEWNSLEEPTINMLYRDAINNSYIKYKRLLELGVAKEQARMILPFGFMTEIYASMNLRSFMHWYIARIDSHAQWEIQQFAKAAIQLVEPHFKHSIEAFKEIKSNV